MIGRLILAVLVLAAAPAAAIEPASNISFSGKSSVMLPLTRAPDGKMFLTAKIQGQAVTLLLDTGASQIVDVAAAQRLGLQCHDTPEAGYGLIGTVDKAQAALINLDLDGLDVWQMRATCLDLSGLRAAFQHYGEPLPDGVLSAEVMALLRARIDYDKRTLELRLPTKSSAAEEMRRRGPPSPQDARQ